MADINIVVANNIIDQMKKHNMKQIDLANAIGVSKQIMSKMLNGSRLIGIAELHKIADYFMLKWMIWCNLLRNLVKWTLSGLLWERLDQKQPGRLCIRQTNWQT